MEYCDAYATAPLFTAKGGALFAIGGVTLLTSTLSGNSANGVEDAEAFGGAVYTNGHFHRFNHRSRVTRLAVAVMREEKRARSR